MRCGHKKKINIKNGWIIADWKLEKKLPSLALNVTKLSASSVVQFLKFLRLKYIHFQRWSPRGRPWPQGRPRGHILKSLASASKPQVLKNRFVLGSRTALFFEPLKLCITIIINGQRYKRICYR